ncbi:MAG: type II toxin-antitoxin system prevent-host-death family antitoxin [Geobacter sp.]|jgi:prevent-host-death family protein|nr:type II toxin-antitoxin system prevent-host-death family antitoxin [Geobacter sp.]
MPLALSKSQFKPHALDYFRRVEQNGDEIIITDHGRPVLKVVPYVADPEEPFRGLRNTVLRYEEPLEPVGAAEWEALN